METLEKRQRRLDDLEVQTEATGNFHTGQLASKVQQFEHQLDGEIQIDARFLEVRGAGGTSARARSRASGVGVASNVVLMTQLLRLASCQAWRALAAAAANSGRARCAASNAFNASACCRRAR